MKTLANTFTRYLNGEVMTTEELIYLNIALNILHEFNLEMKFLPEARFYGMESESVKKIIDARSNE